MRRAAEGLRVHFTACRNRSPMKPTFAVSSSRLPRPAALALVFALTLGSSHAWTQGMPDTPTLGASPQALIDYARQSNPGFAAARLRLIARALDEARIVLTSEESRQSYLQSLNST